MLLQTSETKIAPICSKDFSGLTECALYFAEEKVQLMGLALRYSMHCCFSVQNPLITLLAL